MIASVASEICHPVPILATAGHIFTAFRSIFGTARTNVALLQSEEIAFPCNRELCLVNSCWIPRTLQKYWIAIHVGVSCKYRYDVEYIGKKDQIMRSGWINCIISFSVTI